MTRPNARLTSRIPAISVFPCDASGTSDLQHKQMNFEFSQAEFSELISAAREARIRWKKAKTLWKVRHHAYLKHDENELEENIERFANVEKMLIERYKESTGESWRK